MGDGTEPANRGWGITGMPGGVLLILAIISVLASTYLLTLPRTITGDGTAYATLGEGLISGRGYVGRMDTYGYPAGWIFPPLYPSMLGGFSLFTCNFELAGQLVSLLFKVLLIFPVYFLAKKLYNRKVALLASVFVTIHFLLMYYSVGVFTDLMYSFIFVSMIALGYLVLIEKRNYYLPLGIAIGLAYLTRPEGFGYLFVMGFLAFVFWAFERPEKGGRRLAANILAMAVGFLVVSAPYVAYLYSETGELTLTKKTIHVLMVGEQSRDDPLVYEGIVYGLTEDGERVITRRMNEYNNAFNYILSDPGAMAKRYVMNAWYLFSEDLPMVLPYWLIPVIGIGLFRISWDRRRLRKEFYMIVLIAYSLLLYPMFFGAARFLIPLVILLLVWLANGTYELGRWFRKSQEKLGFRIRIPVIVVPVLVIASFLPTTLAVLSDPYIHQAPSLDREMGAWMKMNIPLDSVIMSRKPMVPFYAGMEHVVLPYANYTEVIEYARGRDVDYFLADRERFLRLRPQLAFLLGEEIPEELEVVHRIEKDDNLMILYQIL